MTFTQSENVGGGYDNCCLRSMGYCSAAAPSRLQSCYGKGSRTVKGDDVQRTWRKRFIELRRMCVFVSIGGWRYRGGCFFALQPTLC